MRDLSHEAWTLVLHGVQAVGTIAVAMLAIFGGRIRAYLVRPKLRMSVGESSPHAERLRRIEAESAGSERVSYRLRIGVHNSGREAARNCTLYCDRVFAERASGGGFFKLREFVPTRFYWTSEDRLTDVVSKMPSYVDVAELSQPEGSSSQSDEHEGSFGTEVHRLQILVEADGVRGRFLRVTEQKVIASVTLYADNITRPVKRYLEICWRGQSLQDVSPSSLQVRLLSEEDGNKLVGGQ